MQPEKSTVVNIRIPQAIAEKLKSSGKPLGQVAKFLVVQGAENPEMLAIAVKKAKPVGKTHLCHDPIVKERATEYGLEHGPTKASRKFGVPLPTVAYWMTLARKQKLTP